MRLHVILELLTRDYQHKVNGKKTQKPTNRDFGPTYFLQAANFLIYLVVNTEIHRVLERQIANDFLLATPLGS